MKFQTYDFYAIKKQVEDALASAPDGKIYLVMHRKKYPQYYFVDDNTKEKYPKRVYLKKENNHLIELLVQKEYNLLVYNELCRLENIMIPNRKALSGKEDSLIDPHTLSSYAFINIPWWRNIIEIYEKMHEEKRKFIEPYILPDKEFLENWYLNNPGCKNSFINNESFITERGEVVRSKSEKMIADKLYYKEIPYVYELELVLQYYGVIYPDFLILNKRNRKAYYLEHFGKMDDPDYCRKAIVKLYGYKNNSIWPGEKLLITMESSQKPFNMQEIDWLIKKYFT